MQKQPPEMFYKKGVLKNFAKFTGNRVVAISAIFSMRSQKSEYDLEQLLFAEPYFLDLGLLWGSLALLYGFYACLELEN